jgi:diguanylate cyclase (GGDEF)-like protein
VRVDGLHGAQIAPSAQQRERLAKEWLLRLIERTPLPDVGELPVSWIVAEAPSLIADIVEALAQPPAEGERTLAESERARVAKLTQLREGPEAAEQIPRDLAALQSLLVECLRRELPARNPAEFARAVERLAEIFGSIQGAVTGLLLDERSGEPDADELTGLPGPTRFDEWMRVLLAEHERYGHGFALAVLDVDGLGRITDAYGRDAGDRLVAAIAAVIRREVRATDPAFRLEEDEFAVLAPHSAASGLVAMALRVAELIDGSQAAEGPRIAIAAGVVSCPADGVDAERLLEAAAEATYAAKAAAKPVATSPASSPTALQDP